MNTRRLQVRSVIVGGHGGAIGVAVMALVVAACTRSLSLGKAGLPDGSDVQVATDARDAESDVAVDRAPDVGADAGVDVQEDAHRDQGIDGDNNCVDNGITYHSGDVVLRAGCQQTCLCLDGTVGACTGLPCPVDGSTIVVDPVPFALITRTASTTSPEINVLVDNRGQAQRMVGNDTVDSVPPPRLFPSGSPEVTLFMYHLQSVGDLTQVGDPNPIFNESCPKSATSGTTTKVQLSPPLTSPSGDLECLINPTGDQIALAHDANVLLGIDDGNDSINALACTNTGGEISNNLCCRGAENFPDSCTVGACTCAPTNLQVVDTCVCPNGGCFVKSVGCIGPANVCTVGADQTCNDDLTINSIHGHCMANGRCSCITTLGSTLLASGKCS